ncbi:MAG: Transcriptional regulator, BadM/Rrf2 family [Parcubacteria group bacterium GW2011_GWA2_43_13]|nr:MAG: Transcriptional regulator, BadM/Rrf2 family [Parcubacteria group bacterium GW2011_GWA2_43_13]OGY68567.1 MAG: hypothetical protein A3B94_00740 [Candidatus Jacksonbacteria bacterium RIFCSPHIGHO2_02_FULL_43_10]OGY70563.1 MAG: hypothetical protein A2986_02535 [Candidatus Jacksonbacteria bacterium RIFCSPLOWO2_01_FULL_44_13]HAZ16339.1 hypothetical protein [Candidatus Jacksonbacteria bacterium]
MFFSTKAHYAVVLLVALAKEDHPVSLRVVAAESGLPFEYCEKIAQDLKKKKIVSSVRGARGGYYLKKQAESVSLADIVKTVERVKPSLRNCTKRLGCDCSQKKCAKKDIWAHVERRVWDALDKVTLQQMM